MIQTMHIADFKARFSEVVKLLDQGFTIRVVKGRAGQLVGYFSKNDLFISNVKPRPSGLLQDKQFELTGDFFEMNEEELKQWGV